MTDLLIIAHCQSQYEGLYQSALTGLPEPWHVRAFIAPPLSSVPGGGLSSRYRALLAQVKSLSGLLAWLRLNPRETWGRVVLASWSSPYPLAWGLLPELDGWIALDSGYTAFDSDHTASDIALRPVAAYAMRAQKGERLLWYGYTDVVTPQTGASAYASTSQVAAELIRMTGGPSGLFAIKHFEHVKGTPPAAWHTEALTGWGPHFVAQALDALVHNDPPTRSKGMRQMVLDVARSQMAVRETDGPNDSPEIRAYLAPCERRDVLFVPPLKRVSWCAAFASWCMREAATRLGLPLGSLPTRYRAAVSELCSDARTRSLLMRPEDGYELGDLVVFGRAGQSPLVGGMGHVGFYDGEPDAARIWVLGGNQPDAVAGEGVTRRARLRSEVLASIRLG